MEHSHADKEKMRAGLRNFGFGLICEDPKGLFEEILIHRLQERNIEIHLRSELKINYPGDIEQALLLINEQGTPAQQLDVARMFAKQSSCSFKPYRAEIRNCLANRNLIVPIASENPEPLFEEQLVSALQGYGVDINDRSQLKINYPVDIPFAVMLIDGNGNKQQLDYAANMFASQSGRPINFKTTQPTAPAPADAAAPIISKADASVVVPRSNAPSPIRLDRTVTAAKLLQNSGSGKSILEVVCEQGRLGDLFTDNIWMGRREEMEKAWEQVPEKYHNQVNIEMVRAQLSQATGRGRIKLNQAEWEQGF